MSNFNSVRKLYDGWLNVEQPSTPAMDRYVTEHMVVFEGGWVETRQYSWSNPVESICSTTSRCYMVNMSLAGWERGGSATNLRSSVEHDAEPLGRLFIIPPAHRVQFKSLQGQRRSIRCMLDAGLFDRFTGPATRKAPGRSAAALFHPSGGEVEWLLRRMERELRDPDFATPQAIEGLARQLTAEIVRALNPRQANAGLRSGGLAPWRMQLIRQRLWADEPLPGVDELAALCGLTMRHLSRAFRRETGQSIGRFVDTAMVDRATGLLDAGARVGEVAKTLGYATAGSFGAAYRRVTGLQPRAVGIHKS
jgi:AraC family transcriptional regulator